MPNATKMGNLMGNYKPPFSTSGFVARLAHQVIPAPDQKQQCAGIMADALSPEARSSLLSMRNQPLRITVGLRMTKFYY